MDFSQQKMLNKSRHVGLAQKQSVRRFIKAMLDFCCGFIAATLGLLAAQRVEPASLLLSLLLSTLVGTVVAAGNAVGLSHRATWRYSGVKEQLVLTLTSCAVFVVLAAVVVAGIARLTLSTVLLIPLLAFALATGARTMRRWHVAQRRRKTRQIPRSPERIAMQHRVLIVGAGFAGFAISQQVEEFRLQNVELVGFLDDDPSTIGALLNGVPVLGRIEDLLPVAERYDVTEVVIALPSAPVEFVRTLMRRAEDIGLRARAFSGIGRLLVNGENHRPGTITLRELTTQQVVNWPAPIATRHGAERRVLVTGGAGFIGSHLTRMLLDRGYHVRILENFTYGDAGIAAIRDHPRLEIVRGDICSLRDVGRAMRDVEGVVALAAIVGDPACNIDPEETINLNYSATKILAEAAEFYRVRRLVFASSCSVYGASVREDDLLNERSRLNPVSLYARTRVLSENIIFDRCGDAEPVVLRLATVFGLSPRMRFDLVVNTLTARAVMDRKIAIFGGRQWRPNVHCRDAARAFLTALEAPADDVAGEVFNVGGDANNHRIAELGNIVAGAVGNVQINLQNEIPDPRDYRVSFAKIQRVLGFEPTYSVRDGVMEVAAAMQTDLSLRMHTDPVFHNVHALRQVLERPNARQALATA